MEITPQMAVIMSFAAGALLFFGIGFFIARVAAQTGKSHGNNEPGRDSAKSLDADVSAVAAKQLEAISQQRDQAIKSYLSLKTYTSRQKEKTRTYFGATRARVTELNNKLETETSTADALKEQTETLARQLRQSDSEKEACLAQKASVSQALEKAQEQYEGALERLKALSGLEDENQALLKRAEKFEGLQKDLEDLRDESHWLKSQLAETETLKDEIDEHKREIARLNAMGILLEKPFSLSAASPLEGLGGSFQNVANQLSQAEGSRGVVLADDLGLLIAGTGDHMEAMAGMAAVFSDVCIKIDSMLPFGEIDSMKITNHQNLTIAMQPFDIASVNVIITTLSVGAEPNRDTINKLIEQVTSS